MTSETSGVWTVDVHRPGDFGGAFTWDITVADGGTAIPGRVWTDRFLMWNREFVDLTLWYVGASGHQYEVSYFDFYGIESLFSSNQFGVVYDGTCESAYQSAEDRPSGPYYDDHLSNSGQECGPLYNMFFAPPAADLPASAADATGATQFILPPVQPPTVSELRFTPDTPDTREGTFSFETNHVGNADLLIDADGNGSYDDTVDRTIPVSVNTGAEPSVAFDGLDGEGNAISPSTRFNATMRITQAGEIHFVNGDVESRGGISVTALTGTADGTSTLYWNDSELQTEERDQSCLPPVLDGRDGQDSSVSGGVHGWPCTPRNPNDGVTGPWGDVRLIDDWTFNPVDVSASVEIPAAEGNYVVTKSSDPEPGTAVHPGDVVTYTIEVAQIGNDSAAANVSDDLSDVLDDASYNGDASATAGEVDVTGTTLNWNGTLLDGGSARITYSVTVDDAGDVSSGDGQVGNVVTSPGCGSDACATEHPVGDYSVEKSAEPAPGSAVTDGDTVAYTLTVAQEGAAAVEGASLVDDLSDVLDDAVWNGDLVASAGAAEFDEDAQELRWSGDLGIDDVVTISYSVMVTGSGDTSVDNTVASDGCGTAEECQSSHPYGGYGVVKSADPAPGGGVAEGETVAYTLTVTQSGQGSVPAELSDDLTAVLDDAVYNDDLQASAGAASYDSESGTIDWDGTLARGDVVTISYSVTVQPVGTGDGSLRNVVTSPGCDSDADCVTENRVGGFVYSKSADGGPGSQVSQGDVITYSVTVTHTGAGPVAEARVSDDLSGVLDDATFNDDASASSGSIRVDGSTLDWTGSLAPGDVVEITYSVTVTGAGDLAVDNVVLTDDPRGVCDPDATCATEHQVPPSPDLPATGARVGAWVIPAALLMTGLGALVLMGARRHRAAEK
ncbi:DUF11 domain-containing protein [Ruania alba]|nr:DUF11 domain-containing protein [Ruania alba]